ncbi:MULTISPECIES: hypothetical protein [unclassified Streptomyces]|uniref:hypothetical protein n=1 Tax=unclassified Streptomyces TaxID=2593676 RepID=UPI001F26A55C|nr:MULTISPECIES: hypothetical protein [unclassified Streptomyces]MCF0086607.1 hypothetical protein [Streptomyces sp. MH192]MCF0098761.1 hypothetical protein [Streptomyces sp. MH191]
MAKSRVKVTFNQAALKKAATKMLDDWAAKVTRKINALSPEYTGRPVPEVKEAVMRVWKREAAGRPLPEAHLTAYAEQIAAGGRVTLKVKK